MQHIVICHAIYAIQMTETNNRPADLCGWYRIVQLQKDSNDLWNPIGDLKHVAPQLHLFSQRRRNSRFGVGTINQRLV